MLEMMSSLFCCGGITRGLEGCGKGGGEGGGGRGNSEGAPPGRRKQNKPDLSRVNILGMINLSRCNRSSKL